MNKVFADLNKLNEDAAVIDDDSPIYIQPYFDTSKRVGHLSPIDFNITNRSREFVEWLERVEQDLIDADYGTGAFSYIEWQQDFIESVMCLDYYGAEVHMGLAGYSIELSLKPFTYKSGVRQPDPTSPYTHNRRNPHILTRELEREVTFVARCKDEINGFIKYFIQAFLLERVPVQEIVPAIEGFYVVEQKAAGNVLTKDMVRIYLDMKYANGHDDDQRVDQLHKKLEKALDGVGWEMTYYDEENLGLVEKLIGFGYTDDLAHLLNSGAIRIEKFVITSGDF